MIRRTPICTRSDTLFPYPTRYLSGVADQLFPHAIQIANPMLSAPPAFKEAAMTSYKSDLLRLLDERGYIHQMTDAEGLDALAASQVVPAYIGFDATAPSPHVGSLVQIMMLRRLQPKGPKPNVEPKSAG